MKKLAVIGGLLAMFAMTAAAQEQPPTEQGQTPSDHGQTEETPPVKPKKVYETPKYEISAGYSYRSYYSPNGPAVNEPGNVGMNGWYVSVDRNYKKWIGLVAEVTDTGKNQGLLLGDAHIYTFGAGVQIYPLGHRKLTPFGHFLYGGGYYRDAIAPFQAFSGNTITSLIKAWEGGGGLDLNLKEHWAIRLIEFDVGSGNYFPSSQTYAASAPHRISVGFVYHFGQR